MSLLEALLILLGLAIAGTAGFLVARGRLGGSRPATVHQILLPFTGQTISRRALDAALRLAKAEDATLMPAYLAIVPMHLPLDSALPKQASKCMPLLEAIEQRAAAQGVPVDSRIERGRSYRHALLRLLEDERFDRVVVPATALPRSGFSGEDLVWLLDQAPAEVVILRPGPEDTRVISSNGRSRDTAGAGDGGRRL
jgi:nucleotide-binding universal stress UspA family protein